MTYRHGPPQAIPLPPPQPVCDPRRGAGQALLRTCLRMRQHFCEPRQARTTAVCARLPARLGAGAPAAGERGRARGGQRARGADRRLPCHRGASLTLRINDTARRHLRRPPAAWNSSGSGSALRGGRLALLPPPGPRPGPFPGQPCC